VRDSILSSVLGMSLSVKYFLLQSQCQNQAFPSVLTACDVLWKTALTAGGSSGRRGCPTEEASGEVQLRRSEAAARRGSRGAL